MMSDSPTDLELVAYIDGELNREDKARVELAVAGDERIAMRLAALSGTTFGIRKAFAPLLSEAPVAKMLASLGESPTRIEPKPVQTVRTVTTHGRRWMIAAGLALVALGGLSDHLAFVPNPITGRENSGHWRDIVASYVRLYTPETFANTSDDWALQTRELQTVGQAIGLHLAPKIIVLSDLTFKQARILQYDSTPIAEIDYLDPYNGPLSLCIMPSNEPRSLPQPEIRRGLNVSYWNDGDHAFMVIGAQPASYLGEVARLFAPALAPVPMAKGGITL
jgi:anti-sigma factor RsiW